MPSNVEPVDEEDRPDPTHMGVYTWRIENYSTYENRRVVHSPTFEKGGFSWRLWLFPKGSVNASEGDMSIFLHYIKKDDVFSIRPVDHPRAKFSIKIRNQLEGEDIQHEIYDFHSFAESNGEWGWKDFAEIDRLFEEFSGLVVEDVLKVELSVFVQPKNVSLWPIDESDEAKTVVVRILTDAQIKKEVGHLYYSGLPMLDEGRSYCLYEQMRYRNLETLICRDLGVSNEDMRLWLCESLPDGHLRIVQNLAASKIKLEMMSDLTQLKNELLPSICDAETLETVHLYIEVPREEEETLKELNNEGEYVAFCKYYDPWEATMSYLGTVPLRKGCKPAEVIVDARMLAGMNANTGVSLYIEAPPSRDIVHELRLEDSLDKVGLRPGCTIIVQPRVDPVYAEKKEMPHPTVRTFLKANDRPRCHSSHSESSQASHLRTEPHDDACVICFTRPKTVGFLHGDSVHRCVCQECAPLVVKNDGGTCPLCRKRIEKVFVHSYLFECDKKKLCSKDFKIGNSKWQLELVAKDEKMQVFLKSRNAMALGVQSSIRLVHPSSPEKDKQKGTCRIFQGDNWGSREFCEISVIKKRENGYLDRGTFKIICCVRLQSLDNEQFICQPRGEVTNFTWRIRDIEELSTYFFASSDFETGSSQWRLQLKLLEDSEGDERLGMYLQMRSEVSIQATFKLQVVNSLGPRRNVLKETKHKFPKSGERHGWSKVIRLEDLLKPEGGFVSGGWTVFNGTVSVGEGIAEVTEEFQNLAVGLFPKRNPEEPDCICCLMKPQTAGFVHGTSSHKCVCADCCKILFERKWNCPICDLKVDSIILNYY